MKTRALSAFPTLFAAACTPSWTGTGPASAPAPAIRASSNDPSFRVVESATGRSVSFATVIAAAAAADVVFFGEQHDDTETHFLEFGLLEGLGRRRENVTLSLEMFERDVQPQLDRYLSGAQSESTFLAASRPWPRYATDYRPMVLLARARGWRVIAANIPRPMASAIARRSLSALDTLTTTERTYAAAAMSCAPGTAYFSRFVEAMGDHGSGSSNAAPSMSAQEAIVRVYEAQCAKDETMAESIVRELASTRGRGVVLHVTGAFHSDYGQGTVERVRRRMPEVRALVITAMPVENPGLAAVGKESAKADYVIFTRAGKSPGG